MNQQVVKNICLRVIDATVETLRTELQEKGVPDSVLESVNQLQARWSERFSHTHDFTDDPLISDKPAPTKSTKRKQTKKKNDKKESSSRNGSMSVAAITNREDAPFDNDKAALPPVPRAKGEPVVPKKEEPVDDLEPPKKRQRVSRDDDEQIITDENLDSSDSDDDRHVDDNVEPANLVLAKHDRVRKGQKWKVGLKEGIVSIRDREYLFNNATCELDPEF